MTTKPIRWMGTLVLCGLAVAAAGCAGRPRHGFILRGNWALEFNRVPWIVSRVHEDSDQAAKTVACEEDCVACDAPAPACGVRDVSCTSCDGAGCDTCQARVRCGGCGFRWRIGPRECRSGESECPRCRRVVRRPLLGGLMRRAPLEPVHHEVPYSRFHPVPTHPVFSNADAPKDAQPTLAPPESASQAVPTPRPPALAIEAPEPESIAPGPSVEAAPPKAKSDAAAKAKPKANDTWQPPPPRTTTPAKPAGASPAPATPSAKSPKGSESSADWLFRNTAPPDAPVPSARGVWQPTSLTQSG